MAISKMIGAKQTRLAAALVARRKTVNPSAGRALNPAEVRGMSVSHQKNSEIVTENGLYGKQKYEVWTKFGRVMPDWAAGALKKLLSGVFGESDDGGSHRFCYLKKLQEECHFLKRREIRVTEGSQGMMYWIPFSLGTRTEHCVHKTYLLLQNERDGSVIESVSLKLPPPPLSDNGGVYDPKKHFLIERYSDGSVMLVVTKYDGMLTYAQSDEV